MAVKRLHLSLSALLALAACTSSFKEEPRRYACARDGGAEQCLSGWRCGLDGFCFDPQTAAPRACLRDVELAHPGADCTQGWRCGLDGVCFDPGASAPRRCDRPFERDAGYDCAEGWHCSVDGICFDARVKSARPCNHEDSVHDGVSYDCAPTWLCGLDNTCFDPAVPYPRPCERDDFEDSGVAVECALNWKCGLDGVCYDSTIAEARQCRAALDRDGGNLDCFPGWRCSATTGSCFNPALPEARPCDRATFLATGLAPECARGWRCGLDDVCYALADAGTHACARSLEATDGGLAVGSDCAPGWRCGIQDVCQDRSVGAPYPCRTDEHCEQGWRCNPLNDTCLLVTDRAPPATALPASMLVSPLLDLGVPRLFAVGDSFEWPRTRSSGQNLITNDSNPNLWVGLYGDVLHLMAQAKQPLPLADGGFSRLVDMSCPVPGADVVALSAWQELAAVQFADGGLSVYGFKSAAGPGPARYPDTCVKVATGLTPQPLARLRAFPMVNGFTSSGSAPPPAFGPGLVALPQGEAVLGLYLDGGQTTVAVAASTPSNFCQTFALDGGLIDVAALAVAGAPDYLVIGLTPTGLTLGQSVTEMVPQPPNPFVPLTPPQVCAGPLNPNGTCSTQPYPAGSTCGGTFPDGSCSVYLPPDGGCGYPPGATWLRPADFGANVPLLIPPGFRPERLAVSERRALAPGPGQVVGTVAVVLAPTDGGVLRLVSAGTVRPAAGSPTPPPGFTLPSERYVIDSPNFNWPSWVAACPSDGVLLGLTAGLNVSASGVSENVLYARCAEGKVPPTPGVLGTVVPARTWTVKGQDTMGFKLVATTNAQYAPFTEDETPFQGPVVAATGDAHRRAFAGSRGRAWLYPAFNDVQSAPVPLRTLLDRAPEAVVRLTPGTPVEQKMGARALAISQGQPYMQSPLGFVGQADVQQGGAGSGGLSFDAVGAVRGRPDLTLTTQFVYNVSQAPYGTGPQVLAQPVGGALGAPAVGELVTTQNVTRLYVSSGDAVWTADVTAQLQNAFVSPAALTRTFSPVPGVPLRSMALGNQYDAAGAPTGKVTGYVIAGVDVYQFSGVPPFWSAKNLGFDVTKTGAPIAVFRQALPAGGDVYRVGYETGVMASLPAPVPLTGPIPDAGAVVQLAQLCGDTYALTPAGLFLYAAGDGRLADGGFSVPFPDGGWTLVYPDAGTALFETTASLFAATPRGDVVEFSLRSDGGVPVCGP